MTKRHTKRTTTSFVQLPLLGNIAIYARVATGDKLTGDTPPAQVDESLSYALSLGFSSDQVTVLYDEGEAAFAPLLAAIREGEANVILLRAEDDLFTGATELQVNNFIHLCIDKGVFVVTPQMIYDFQNLTLASLFRVHFVKAYQVCETVHAH